MKKELIKSFLESFAVGDAFGKVTEYCSRKEIEKNYSSITTILPPSLSLSHKDLLHGRVTDDTEQVIYLIKTYSEKKRVDSYDTALTLLSWVEECNAYSYMGPSSLKALNYIKNGGDIEKAGIYGTTCGGLMRSPASFLFSNEDNIVTNTFNCLKPTHNTVLAMEAALSYTFALMEAKKDSATIESIINRAKEGAELGSKYGNRERTNGVGPSLVSRIIFLEKTIPSLKNDKELKILLYDILGTTLSSIDCASAIFGLFLYTKGDVISTIEIATETGGDTDTISALSASLSTLYRKGHNIRPKMIELVSKANNIDFDYLTELIYNAQEDDKK